MLTKDERDSLINGYKVQMEKAKEAESQNKGKVSELIADAENIVHPRFLIRRFWLLANRETELFAFND